MFEILMECSVNPTEDREYIFCEDMLSGGYYIFYKRGGKRKEDALYFGYDYKAAIVAWERFKSGKCD